jgi:tetratricopeptide (TPR) repeat protein
MSRARPGTPRKKKVAKKRPKRRTAESPPPMFLDRRAMEKAMLDLTRLMEEQEFSSLEEANAFLQQFHNVRDLPASSRALSPLEQAQDKMYEAWNASGKKREKLAREALALCPDCADAYVLLAEETARTPEAAREFYEQGVQAGERALGPEVFAEAAGHFWGMLETRPYMRARAGLGEALWELGDKPQAIAHYQELLRLNPNDNQGLRYVLAGWLLETGDDAALGQLFKQYQDDAAAAWLYTRALWTFRQHGANKQARRVLADAFEQNRFVPIYLLGFKKMPARPPAYIGFGDDNEAIMYVGEYGLAWLETPGAIEWFVKVFTEEAEKFVRENK